MAQRSHDLDTNGRFPTPVEYFGRPFQRVSHALLIGKCPFPDFACPLSYDYRVPSELESCFPFFESVWPKVRRAPTFCALFLCVFAASGVASLPRAVLPLLLNLLDQTPTFDATLLNVVVPAAFRFLGECARIDNFFNGIVKRFPLNQVLPLFATAPPKRVFLEMFKRIVAHSRLTAELAEVVLSVLASLAHPDADAIRDLLPGDHDRDAPLVGRLTAVLDQIERDCVIDNPMQTVTLLAGQLRRFPFPAGRPFEPVFKFCLTTWSGLDESDRDFHANETNILYVLRKLHKIHGKAEAVYRLYQTLAREQMFAPAKLEQAYQYLQVQFEGVLPSDEKMQLSLARVTDDIDGRSELAIEAIMRLATAYEGVQMMWELLCDQPGFELETKFVRLPMTARCFLIEGFRVRIEADTGEGREERKALLGRLADLSHELAERTRERQDEVQSLNEKLISARARMDQTRTPERPKKQQPRQQRRSQSAKPRQKG
jgi:hypothetical protein